MVTLIDTTEAWSLLRSEITVDRCYKIFTDAALTEYAYFVLTDWVVIVYYVYVDGSGLWCDGGIRGINLDIREFTPPLYLGYAFQCSNLYNLVGDGNPELWRNLYHVSYSNSERFWIYGDSSVGEPNIVTHLQDVLKFIAKHKNLISKVNLETSLLYDQIDIDKSGSIDVNEEATWSQESWSELNGVETQYVDNIGVFMPTSLRVNAQYTLKWRRMGLSQKFCVTEDESYTAKDVIDSASHIPVIGRFIGEFLDSFIAVYIFPKIRTFGRDYIQPFETNLRGMYAWQPNTNEKQRVDLSIAEAIRQGGRNALLDLIALEFRQVTVLTYDMMLQLYPEFCMSMDSTNNKDWESYKRADLKFSVKLPSEEPNADWDNDGYLNNMDEDPYDPKVF